MPEYDDDTSTGHIGLYGPMDYSLHAWLCKQTSLGPTNVAWALVQSSTVREARAILSRHEETRTMPERQLTPEDIKTFQRRGGHPLTCRQCRGAGQCDRTDVGLAVGDHHVLHGHVNEDGTLVLRCSCCGYQQELWGQLETIIRQVAD